MDRRISVTKKYILLKAIYSFNAISIRIPVTFLQKQKKKFLNLYRITEDPFVYCHPAYLTYMQSTS